MIKQNLVDNFLGRTLFSLRDKYELFREAHYWPEAVVTTANDQLATKLVTSICKSNGTFIDVGAHIGSIIGKVRHNLPNVKIIAIEAIPEKIDNLKNKFPNVELHDCAVGESNGETTFYVNKTNSGYSTLGKPNKTNTDLIHPINVTIKRLDDIITANNVDVIKIDVEGAELGVLRGATNLISRCRPVIMFESGPTVSGNLIYTKEELYDFFQKANYSLVTPSRLPFSTKGLSLDVFLDCHDFPRISTNFFAVPTERSEEIKAIAHKMLQPKP
jgi:FkbM family methyltransferase